MYSTSIIEGFYRRSLIAVACIALSAGCTNTFQPVEPELGGTEEPDDRREIRDAGDPDLSDADDVQQDETASEEPDGAVDEEPPDGEPPGIDFEPQKSRVLLLIDRSGSMVEQADCPEASCPSKWEQLLALGVYLAEVKRSAEIGLALFPDPEYESCSVASSMTIPITDAPDIDEKIMAALQETRPGGQTPLAAAMDMVGEFGGLDDPERDNVLVILTDGRPNCACGTGDDVCEREEAVAAAQRLEDLDANLNVYVVGFGVSAEVASDTLTAVAGVSGRRYYQADTIEELISKLYEVSVENMPCTYELQTQPYPESIVVWFDDEQVPECSSEPCDDGFTYDRSTGEVEFHGVWCAALRNVEQPAIAIDVNP